MVHKCKFLAVVLSSLVVFCGGRVMAAQQCSGQQLGNGFCGTGNQKKQIKRNQPGGQWCGLSAGKNRSQQPVASKQKPCGKTSTIQEQVPPSKGKTNVQQQAPAQKKPIFVKKKQQGPQRFQQ
jgi:hypothetical protein